MDADWLLCFLIESLKAKLLEGVSTFIEEVGVVLLILEGVLLDNRLRLAGGVLVEDFFGDEVMISKSHPMWAWNCKFVYIYEIQNLFLFQVAL